MHPPQSDAPSIRRPRLLLLTALAYAVALGVFIQQAVVGVETFGVRWVLFALAILIYALLSLAAVWRRPENPQVMVFIATGLSISATIVWPLPDFDGPFSALWAAELLVFSLVYTLSVALFIHLAALIPRPQPAPGRRWVIAGAYALAVVLALLSFLPYVNVASPFLPWRWELEAVMRYDAKLNHAGNFLGGLICMILLARSARRDAAPEGRRQALVVLLGLLPWTFRQGRRLFFPLPRATELVLGILSPLTILAFAASFFVAIAGFQLFHLGPLMRKSVAYVLSTTVIAAAAYGTIVVVGFVASDAVGLDTPLWLEGAVLVAGGIAFQPLSTRLGQVFDRFFYPEKRDLRELQRSLLPELAGISGFGPTAMHLVRALTSRLHLSSAALLVADERRAFFRARALAGSPENQPASAHAVLTRAHLEALWRAGPRGPLCRDPGGSGEAPELRGTLDLLGARYVLPVEYRGELTGVLTLGDTATGTEFDREDFERLEVVAQGVSAMLENARLFALATHDHLTGLPQRRVFEERLELELERARRSYRPFALGVADLDDFKSVNDSLGHLAGDRVLRRVARALAEQGRGIDVIARFGGEEFTILLTDTDAEGARAFGERVRRALRELGAPQGEAVTISLGFTVVRQEDLYLPQEELVRRADTALYEAKRAGKDCIRLDDPALVV